MSHPTELSWVFVCIFCANPRTHVSVFVCVFFVYFSLLSIAGCLSHLSTYSVRDVTGISPLPEVCRGRSTSPAALQRRATRGRPVFLQPQLLHLPLWLAEKHTRTHTHTHTHARARTRTHKHTHSLTHSRTHTHSHTHTHTHMYLWECGLQQIVFFGLKGIMQIA